MSDTATAPATTPPPTDQLTQVRVPLDQAAEAFASKDASGRTPILVLTKRQNRISNQTMLLAVIVLVGGFIGAWLLDNPLLPTLTVPLAIVLAVLGTWRSFYVHVPEGVSALLARRGRYERMIGGGAYFMPPWIVVTHLVTRRELPYDVPVLEAATADNVRAAVDVLMTFTIADPYRFVYTITADDFDLVLQSACQEALRGLIRRTLSSQISDLLGSATTDLRTAINATVEHYGVSITQVAITSARPPEALLRSEESRQLAILQRAEQAEQQALAQQRLEDAHALERQKVVALAEREREALRLQVEQIALRKQIADMTADVEELRLARLETHLQRYPRATEWEWEGEKLEVARALAANSRLWLQAGAVDDLFRSVALRGLVQGSGDTPPDATPESQNSSGAALTVESQDGSGAAPESQDSSGTAPESQNSSGAAPATIRGKSRLSKV